MEIFTYNKAKDEHSPISAGIHSDKEFPSNCNIERELTLPSLAGIAPNKWL